MSARDEISPRVAARHLLDSGCISLYEEERRRVVLFYGMYLLDWKSYLVRGRRLLRGVQWKHGDRVLEIPDQLLFLDTIDISKHVCVRRISFPEEIRGILDHICAILKKYGEREGRAVAVARLVCSTKPLIRSHWFDDTKPEERNLPWVLEAFPRGKIPFRKHVREYRKLLPL